MKKIVILLFTLGGFVIAQAQTTKEEARRIVLGQPKSGTTTQQGRTIILERNEQNRKVYRTNRATYYSKKSNPGKHLGWHKEEGNPHRYGANPGKGKKKG